METFITILILLLVMIICYYINRYIFKKQTNNDFWGWGEVKTNLLMSIFIPVSFAYWIIYLINILPSLPEEPPKWL